MHQGGTRGELKVSQVIGLGLTTEIFNSNKAFALFE
jgi:hypothetical protein